MTDAPNTRPSLLVRIRNRHDEHAWAEFLEIYTPLICQLTRKRGLRNGSARRALIADSRASSR